MVLRYLSLGAYLVSSLVGIFHATASVLAHAIERAFEIAWPRAEAIHLRALLPGAPAELGGVEARAYRARRVERASAERRSSPWFLPAAALAA